MAKLLGDKAAKQIAETVRTVRGLPQGGSGATQERRVPFQELFVTGKIDGTLAPDGTATLSIYKPSTTGGIGTDTTVNVNVVDGGKLQGTLAASTIVDAVYTRGVWLVVGWECPT